MLCSQSVPILNQAKLSCPVLEVQAKSCARDSLQEMRMFQNTALIGCFCCPLQNFLLSHILMIKLNRQLPIPFKATYT